MLRAFVLLLLIVNLAFYAFTQGWLDSVVGVRARGDHEPERLEHQVRPQWVTVLTPQALADAASAAAARLQCLEAGPFSGGTELAAAEGVLATVLPAGSWTDVKRDAPAAWIVYMGKYPNRDAQKKKEDELARAHVAFEELAGAPDLEPGLSLGRFDERAAAEAALARLTQRGVRSAKVVELAKPAPRHMLRVERADPDLAARVTGLRSDALGAGFSACAARP